MALPLRYPPAGQGRAGSEFDFLDIILATAAHRVAGTEWPEDWGGNIRRKTSEWLEAWGRSKGQHISAQLGLIFLRKATLPRASSPFSFWEIEFLNDASVRVPQTPR